LSQAWYEIYAPHVQAANCLERARLSISLDLEQFFKMHFKSNAFKKAFKKAFKEAFKKHLKKNKLKKHLKLKKND
jgi:hypothetical protein